MKNLSFFLLCLFMVTSSVMQGQNLNNGLHAHYKFNGSLADETANNHDLTTESGNITYSSVSATDSVLVFDGSSSISLINNFNNSTFTETAISLWFNSATITSNLQVILQGAFMGFSVAVQPNTGKIIGFFDSTSPGSYASSSSLADGNWHHIVVQSNGGTTFMYVDGIFDGSISETLFVGNGAANNKFYLGKSNLGALNFTGSVNEVRIYDRVLTPCEISELYIGTNVTSQPSMVTTTACNSYTSPSGNYIWTSSGTYADTLFGANASGCDSSMSIDLTINHSNASTLFASSCYTYISPSGNYIWTNTGTYSDTLFGANANGCDSVISVNLTINYGSTSTISVSACDSYVSPSGNYTWTSSGTYNDTLFGANTYGCDSIITTNLTITPINISVIQSGTALTASFSGASYQWLSCGENFATISGATNQTYIASSNGSYAVEITQNDCIDTSACYEVIGVSIVENSIDGALLVYPNPTIGNLTVNLGKNHNAVTAKVLNTKGQVLSSKEYVSTEELNLEIEGKPGYYFIEITTTGKVRPLIRILKQ